MGSAPSRCVILRGGGGHANAVEPVAVWDDGESVHPALSGLPLLRSAVEALAWAAGKGKVSCYVCVGSPALRARLAEEARTAFPGAEFPSVVGAGYVSDLAEIGEGCYIFGAIVSSHARVGRFCILGYNSLLSHDAELGDFVNLNAAVNLGGYAKIGSGSALAMGSCVADHVSVAERTTLGMNAVVHKDITEPGQTWVGVPAKPITRRAQRGNSVDPVRARM